MKVKVKVTVMSRPESWSGQSFPSGDLPNPGIEPSSPALQVDSLPAEPLSKNHKVLKGEFIMGKYTDFSFKEYSMIGKIP